MSTINFNAETVDPSIPFEAIPAGRYIAVITASEMKDTRSGSGRYLQLEFEICEGEYSGRKVWTRLNLENSNTEAVRIARADLSAICHAVGVLQPEDSVQLHNLPLQITVKCRKNQDDEMTNEIKSFAPVPTPVQAETPASDSQADADSSTPPWARA